MLTFLAGIAGMAVALLVTYLVPPLPLFSEMYKTANHDGDIILRASADTMVFSFLILALVGIVSGLLAAMCAARMDPTRRAAAPVIAPPKHFSIGVLGVESVKGVSPSENATALLLSVYPLNRKMR